MLKSICLLGSLQFHRKGIELQKYVDADLNKRTVFWGIFGYSWKTKHQNIKWTMPLKKAVFLFHYHHSYRSVSYQACITTVPIVLVWFFFLKTGPRTKVFTVNRSVTQAILVIRVTTAKWKVLKNFNSWISQCFVSGQISTLTCLLCYELYRSYSQNVLCSCFSSQENLSSQTASSCFIINLIHYLSCWKILWCIFFFFYI